MGNDTHKALQSNIIYRHFDLPASFPVIGLLGDQWKIGPEKPTFMHFHNCLEIGVLYSGKGTYYIGEQAVEYSAPCLVLAPPHVPHSNMAKPSDTCFFKWLYVDPLLLIPGLDPYTSKEIGEFQQNLAGVDCVIDAAASKRAYDIASMIADEMEENAPNSSETVTQLFHALFLILLRMKRRQESEKEEGKQSLNLIVPAITHIANNYMNDISVNELAVKCHVSASHFRRLFRQILGRSPQEYLQIVRIERACVLLYSSDEPVNAIGAKVGYQTPSSFSRQFRHIKNMSPAQWRQMIRTEKHKISTAFFDALP